VSQACSFQECKPHTLFMLCTHHNSTAWGGTIVCTPCTPSCASPSFVHLQSVSLSLEEISLPSHLLTSQHWDVCMHGCHVHLGLVKTNSAPFSVVVLTLTRSLYIMFEYGVSYHTLTHLHEQQCARSLTWENSSDNARTLPSFPRFKR